MKALEYEEHIALDDSRVAVCGDWHGNVGWLRTLARVISALAPDVTTILQLGDWWLDPAVTPGVPRGGGLSGPRRRDRDGVSHRAMVSENDQELTQKDDTARWLLTSLPSSSCSGN